MTTIADMHSATNENTDAVQTPDLSKHYRLENSDNPGAVLVTELLTTENYPGHSGEPSELRISLGSSMEHCPNLNQEHLF